MNNIKFLFFQAWVLCLFALGNQAFCQPPSIPHPDSLMKQADVLFEKEDYSGSEHLFYQAQNLYLSQKDYSNYVAVYTHLSRVFEAAGKEKQQRAMINLALEKSDSLLHPESPIRGIAEMQLGECFLVKGQIDSALYYLETSLLKLEGSNRHEDLTWNYCDLAVLHLFTMEIKKANIRLRKADSVAKGFLPKSHIAHPSISQLLGRVYTRLGNFDKALSLAKQSLATLKEFPVVTYTDSMDLARGYNGLGVLHFLKGDFGLAISHFHKTLAIYRSHPQSNLLDIGLCLNNMGTAYRKMGQAEKSLQTLLAADYYLTDVRDFIENEQLYLAQISIAAHYIETNNIETAEQYLQKAFRVAETWNLKKQLAYHEQGRCFQAKAQYPDARKAFSAAIQILKKTQPDKNIQVGIEYMHIGKTYMAEAKWDSALHHLQLALSQFVYDFDATNWEENPGAQAPFSSWEILSCLQDKASCLLQASMEEHNTQKSKLLQVSQQTFLRGTEILLRFRDACVQTESKMILNATARPLYEGAIRTSLDLYANTRDSSFLDLAFVLSERARGMALLESRWEGELPGFSPQAKDLLRQENKIRRDMAFYQGKALQEENKNSGIDSLKLETWKGKVFDLQQELLQWGQEVQTVFPEYFRQSKTTTTFPRQVRDTLLGPGELFIEYFEGETELFAFAVSQTSTKAYRWPISSKQRALIGQLVHSISNRIFIHDSVQRAYQSFVNSSTRIYNWLLAPILKDHPGISTLSITPDGSLHRFPFDVLLTGPPPSEDVDFISLPYLIHKYPVKYAFSAAIELDLRKQKSFAPTGECLAFAPSYPPQQAPISQGEISVLRTSGAQLPGAQHEVAAIAESGLQGRFLFGLNANESQFKALAPEYRIIHLAMHGFADNEEPLNSHIVFSQTNSDTCEDNRLYGYELPTLSLKADLVVLSACESGSGKNQAGEGILSLGRAFMVSGAKATIMTLWKVDDQASGQLMRSYYEHLQEGESSSQALHSAKLDYLAKADSRLAHPFYWAGYISNGTSQPLPPSQFPFVWALGLSTGIVFSGYLFLLRKRRIKTTLYPNKWIATAG